MTQYQLFATTPKAMEGILANEIQALGGKNVQQKMAGVAFQGDLAMAYQACLWLRTASRVLLLLGSFEVKSQQDLYDGVQRIDWPEHLNADDSLAVSFSSKNNAAINNTHFGALKVKDAIVDQMRAKFGSRPNVDTEQPHTRVLTGNRARGPTGAAGQIEHTLAGFGGQAKDAVLNRIADHSADAFVVGAPRIPGGGGLLVMRLN